MIYRSRSILGKTKGIDYDDLLKFAQLNGVRGAKASVDSVCKTLVRWREFAQNRGVFPQWIDIIEKYISEQVPYEYSCKMQGWVLPPFEPFTLDDGREITLVRFEETESGNVHMYAVIDGIERRYVFSGKKAESKNLKYAGLDRMPHDSKIELVIRYF